LKRIFILFFLIFSVPATIYSDETGSETGFLSVETVPSGIDVFVNGKKIGKSPVFRHEVASGISILSIGSEPCFKSVLFYTLNRSVYVEKGKEHKVKIIPEPVLTSITVGSVKINGKEHAGLPVYVDGVLVGLQPGSFEVPVCSSVIEITEESSNKVVQSSTIDLLEGTVVERDERFYEINVSEKKEKKLPKHSFSSLEFHKPKESFQLRKQKKKKNIFGDYKWYGATLIVAGALSAGLGAAFDYLAYKEFEKYKNMGSKERIREEIVKDDFDKELFSSNRDKHYSDGYKYSNARTALYVAGGVSFATGIVLLFLPKQKSEEKNIEVNISPSERGFYIGATINY